MPDPALPASVLTGLTQTGLSQRQQSASFGDLGRERYEGKKKWQRNRLQKGDLIGQGEIKQAVELKVTQTSEEGQRKKVTRLEKGLRRQNSISFPHCLPWLSSQVGNTWNQKTVFPDKLGTTWKQGFPYSLQSFENCLLPTHSNQGHRNLRGVQRDRLFPTQICSHFAEILLTPSSNDQTSAEAVGLYLIPQRHTPLERCMQGKPGIMFPRGSGCSRSKWWRVSAGAPPGPSLCQGTQGHCTVSQRK